jgi:hypothetical protein
MKLAFIFSLILGLTIAQNISSFFLTNDFVANATITDEFTIQFEDSDSGIIGEQIIAAKDITYDADAHSFLVKPFTYFQFLLDENLCTIKSSVFSFDLKGQNYEKLCFVHNMEKRDIQACCKTQDFRCCFFCNGGLFNNPCATVPALKAGCVYSGGNLDDRGCSCGFMC